MQVSIDGKSIQPENIAFNEQQQQNIYLYDYNSDIKWYTWNSIYKPNGITKIEVYFILKTNKASVRQDYNGQDYNSFIYVLETGATWKLPIREGTITIQLMDGLTSKYIQGIYPNSIFKINQEKNILSYIFEDLEPTNQDNIAITYYKKNEDFNFRDVVKKSDIYFNEINDFSKKRIDDNLTTITFDSPFDIPDITGKVLGGIFFGGIALFVVFISLIVYFIVRLIKRK
ncbi:MAG: hypothetical protein ACI94Y_003258 [Maribacter sp.]|jgi:hypothetical protein